MGRVCAASIEGIKTDFPTCYALYDTFSDDSVADENLLNAKTVYRVLQERRRIDTQLLEEVRLTHLAKRAELELLYRRLPKGMVQGDLSGDNVLVDENLNFAGVIDFNLSGTETIVRYALEAGFVPPSGAQGKLWSDPGYLAERDRRLRVYFDVFREYYALSIEEKQALGLIYNVIQPFSWPMVSELLHFFRRGNFTEVNARLKWMYRELTRTDIADVLLGAR